MVQASTGGSCQREGPPGPEVARTVGPPPGRLLPRFIANGADYGFTQAGVSILQTHRVIGGNHLSARRGRRDCDRRVAVRSIEMGRDAVDIGKTIHPPDARRRRRPRINI